jgi:arsenite methyltransferase
MRRVDYGIDAPGVIRNFFVIGGLLLLAVIFGPPSVGPFRVGGTSVTLGIRGMFAGAAISCLLGGALMILYAEVGKFRHRDRMLAMIPWTGAENVLDVGTGRGLLAIGAAKRLTTGRVVGIDIWNAADLTGNTADNFLANAELEGVAERVEVRNADARRMPFPVGSFDVVLSNVCLHNIADAKGRAEACREIGRVLRPGGVALVSDFRETALYAAAFREADFSVERSRLGLFDTFPPMRIVTARKPAAP